jgi:hypothetical protein
MKRPWSMRGAGAGLFLCATAALAEGTTLTVRVRSGDEPAPPDTWVRLFRPSPLCGSARYESAEVHHVDGAGEVRFEDVSGPVAVLAEQHELGKVSLPVDVVAGPVTLTFPQPGLALKGQVLDERGAPVPGLSFDLRPLRARPTNRSDPWVTTDAEGRFVARALAPGEYLMTSNSELATALYVPVKVKVQAGDLDVQLKVKAVRRLEGQVVSREGQPQPQVRVFADAERPTGQGGDLVSRLTDDTGHFSLPVRTSARWVAAFDDCLRAGAAQRVQRGKELVVVVPDSTTLTGQLLGPDGPLSEVEFELEAGPPGSPCREPTWSWRPDVQASQWPVVFRGTHLTPTDGGFTTGRLPLNTTAVRFSVNGLTTRWVDVKPVRDGVVDVGIVRLTHGARLQGHVTGRDDQRAGISGTDLRVEPQEGSHHVLERTFYGADFDVPHLPPGRVRVWLHTTDQGDTAPVELELHDDEVKRLDFTLSAPP